MKEGGRGQRKRARDDLLANTCGWKKTHLLEQGVSDRSETAGKRCTVSMLCPAWVPRARLGPPESLTPSLAFFVQSKVDTEYSDPFDAQPHPPPPDDGYMEPYDAQRVMSGE